MRSKVSKSLSTKLSLSHTFDWPLHDFTKIKKYYWQKRNLLPSSVNVTWFDILQELRTFLSFWTMKDILISILHIHSCTSMCINLCINLSYSLRWRHFVSSSILPFHSPFSRKTIKPSGCLSSLSTAFEKTIREREPIIFERIPEFISSRHSILLFLPFRLGCSLILQRAEVSPWSIWYLISSLQSGSFHYSSFHIEYSHRSK